MSSAICLNLDQSKILSFGNELKLLSQVYVAFAVRVDQDQVGQHKHLIFDLFCPLRQNTVDY